LEKSDSYITFSEAAAILGVTRGTVSKWSKKGRFTDNGLKGQKRRLSKVCVLLVKQEIDDEYLKNDAAELRNDARRIR
jgi:excisionase family DNA binding protein